jgi:hypothetical protein
MTHSVHTSPADDFRTSVSSNDVAAIEAALAAYLAWFHSSRRNLEEVAAARDLVEWGFRAAVAHRSAIGDELARLTTLSTAYCPHRLANTWRLDA